VKIDSDCTGFGFLRKIGGRGGGPSRVLCSRWQSAVWRDRNGGECSGFSDEADDAALSLFGTSDTLDVVSGLIEFFKAGSG